MIIIFRAVQAIGGATICQLELSEVLQLKPSPEYLLGGKWYYLQRGPLVMKSEKSMTKLRQSRQHGALLILAMMLVPTHEQCS